MPHNKRIPWNRERNYNVPNALDIKGRRHYVKATVNEIKKLLGNLVKKIRLAKTSGYVEIIHSDNRGNIVTILRENGYKIEFGK